MKISILVLLSVLIVGTYGTRCMLGFSFMDEGDVKMDGCCKWFYRCAATGMIKKSFKCPYPTKCHKGRCVCEEGMVASGTLGMYGGLVDKCTLKKCMVDGKEVKSGASVLSQNCKVKRQCCRGVIKDADFACPENSACDNKGKCVCKLGTEKISESLGGLIQNCKLKRCKLDGQDMKEGSTKLSMACDKKFICKNGDVTKSGFSCPLSTHCQSGRCVCDTGYEKISTAFYGLADVCKAKICKVDGKVLKEGAISLSNDCSQLHICRLGDVKSETVACPKFAKCSEGKCTCEEGAEKVGSLYNGLVELCKEKKCFVEKTEIQDGDVLLSNDCKTKHVCKKGTVKNSPYECSDLAICNSGHCVCSPGSEEVRTQFDGLVQHCKKKICELNGLSMKEGEQKLNDGCTKLHKCTLGDVTDTPYACPSNSDCEKNQCICDRGYKETSGSTVSPVCEKKVCTMDGEDMKEGGVKLSNDCSKKHECEFGDVNTKNFKCPALSKCNGKGRCVCKKGNKEEKTILDGSVQVCKKKVCKLMGQPMKEGDVGLSGDCGTRYECVLGDVKDTSFTCPDNTQCDNNGKCECVKGHEKVGEDLGGAVEKCDRKVCLYNGKEMKEGERQLSNDCQTTNECILGEVNPTPFNCPENTECNGNGQCNCVEGYAPIGKEPTGFVDTCEKKVCKHLGQDMKEGEVKLSLDCRRRYVCSLGDVDPKPNECPAHTECDGSGKCVCELGYSVDKEELDGQVQICKKKTCRVDGRPLPDDESRLSDDCSKLYKCEHGDVKEDPHTCPDNSVCNAGRCLCKKGHTSVGEDLGGLVQICDKKVCLHDGKPMKEGAQVLSGDCTKRHRCTLGDVVEFDFTCPGQTECNENNVCVCKKGYKKTRSRNNGKVHICTKKVCKVEGDKIVPEGGSLVSADCTKIYTCVYGDVSDAPLQCPGNTQCENRRCVCKEGYTPTGTDFDGAVDICTLRPCVVDGQTIEEGGTYISEDCAFKLTCKLGIINDEDFGCHDHTHCGDHRCVCDEGFKVTESSGPRDKCEKKVCEVDGKPIPEGAVVLNADCSREISCNNGETSGNDFECPTLSSCKAGTCVCNENAYEESKSENNLISYCKPKDCLPEALKDGESRLNEDCSAIDICTKGDVTSTSSSCKDDTVCDHGKCVCKPGFEKTGESDNGFHESCKQKQCKLGDKIIEEGSTYLSESCDKKYVCKKGVVETTDFTCPSPTQCNNEFHGKCVCPSGYDMTGTSEGGVVQDCKEKVCKAYGNILKEGEIAMNQDCSQVIMCDGGEPQNYPYSCPIYTTCDKSGKCLCDEGTVKIGVRFGGQVDECKCLCEEEDH